MKGTALLRARAEMYWMVLRTCIEERLVYRGDFALGTLMRFLPILTQIFLWTAVFQSAGSTEIAGYTQRDVIAYYLLTMLARAFSSMPGLASGIAEQIRSGEIKKFLIQPIDLLSFLLVSRVAHKLVYYTVATGPFVLVFFLCGDYFNGWPDARTLACGISSMVLSFLLGFYLEAAIGMVGFWFLEVSSLLFVYQLFNFFFSGHMFPLEFLKGIPALYWLAEWLPLQYLAYFPAAVLLGKITGDDLVNGVLMQGAWTLIMIAICRLSLAAGYRRYSAYGG